MQCKGAVVYPCVRQDGLLKVEVYLYILLTLAL